MRKQELHPRTAVINKTQKNQSKKARLEALVWLAQTFPLAFDNSLRIRPLKTGIMDDILHYADQALTEANISKSKLREAVVLFTRRIDYLACLKAREMRIDLQGNVLNEVTEEEAEHAAAKIKKRVEKSVRNARKMLAAQTINSVGRDNNLSTNSFKTMNQTAGVADDYLPTYPLRAAPAANQSAAVPPARTAAVIVKHKTTRQFDPDAVARLKEKLGLSRGVEKTETAE